MISCYIKTAASKVQTCPESTRSFFIYTACTPPLLGISGYADEKRFYVASPFKVDCFPLWMIGIILDAVLSRGYC